MTTVLNAALQIKEPVFSFTGTRVIVTGHQFTRIYERQFLTNVSLKELTLQNITTVSFVVVLKKNNTITVASLSPNTTYDVILQLVEEDVVYKSASYEVTTNRFVRFLKYTQSARSLHMQLGDSSIRIIRSIFPVPTFNQ